MPGGLYWGRASQVPPQLPLHLQIPPRGHLDAWGQTPRPWAGGLLCERNWGSANIIMQTQW